MAFFTGLMAGVGEGLQSTGKMFENQATQEQKANDSQDLAKLQSDLALQKEKAIDDYKNQLANAPFQRAGEFIKNAQGQEVPVQPKPVTDLSGAEPNVAYKGGKGVGMVGDYEDLKKKAFTIPVGADRNAYLAQLESQFASDKQSAQDVVAGQTRKLNPSEVLKAAHEKSLSDPQAAAVLAKAISESQVNVGQNSSLVDRNTGEPIYENTTITDRLIKAEEGRNARLEATLASREKLSADKLGAQHPDASNISQGEKDLAVQTWIMNTGGLRGLSKTAQDNVLTWAAEKGIMPEDLAAGRAQAKFDQSSATTSGHRAGTLAVVEAAMPALVQNALRVSKDLDQGNFVPLNKLMQMAESNISDPKLAAFKVAHQALISEYQQVIAKGGANVFALKEAMHVLNGATSYDAYESALNQVLQEVKANTDASRKVRADMAGNKEQPSTQNRRSTDRPSASTSKLPAGFVLDK